MRIGVISDTHGVLSKWAVEAFDGVDLIVHAGDVGRMSVVDELECIAPVVAVRGNMDSGLGTSALPDHRRLELERVRVLVVHDPAHVRSLVEAAPADVVVVGHTHRPRIENAAGFLRLNPGSASSSVGEGLSVALLRIDDGTPQAEIVRESG